ncbi:hypothetical protein GcM3_032040 [Golovinomyces cichoracearum]|uniref:Uncharacterized protein n=1 Tax=Golovinomyces cichoracearum TaxID=62708 RepID=A0A420J4L2_9PEZI|nr:hypothetical protein GcM3_032040 [Golovinomyces cichoracearum]
MTYTEQKIYEGNSSPSKLSLENQSGKIDPSTSSIPLLPYGIARQLIDLAKLYVDQV